MFWPRALQKLCSKFANTNKFCVDEKIRALALNKYLQQIACVVVTYLNYVCATVLSFLVIACTASSGSAGVIRVTPGSAGKGHRVQCRCQSVLVRMSDREGVWVDRIAQDSEIKNSDAKAANNNTSTTHHNTTRHSYRNL